MGQYELSPINMKIKKLPHPKYASFEVKDALQKQVFETLEELGKIENTSVIHGDLQNKNIINTGSSSKVIDPFVVSGEKEADLALWITTCESGQEIEDILGGLEQEKLTKRLALWLDFFALTEQRLYHSQRLEVLNTWLVDRGKRILT